MHDGLVEDLHAHVMLTGVSAARRQLVGNDVTVLHGADVTNILPRACRVVQGGQFDLESGKY